MKKAILIIQFIIFQNIVGQTYNDRVLIYIENSVKNFEIIENSNKTNVDELNNELENIGATKIRQWLPNARPTDRDGDTYLNRYYIIELGSDREDINLILQSIENSITANHP